MSLFRRMFGLAPRADAVTVQGPLDLNDPRVIEWLRAGNESIAGVAVTEESALSVAVAWRCVNLRAGVLAGLPLDLVRRVDDKRREPASDHQIWPLLKRRPNRWQSAYQFRRQLQAHVLLRGNGYAMKVRSRGLVTDLWPLNPDRVRVEQLDNNALVYHYTRANGVEITLAQADVLHLRGLTLDGITGLAPLRYARESLGLQLQAQRAGAKMLRTGVLGGFGLKHPGKLSDTAVGHIRDSISDRYGGADNVGRPLIFEEGMEPVNIGFSAEDLQFLESRRFERGEIAMFFGVPPHLIGDTDKSTSWGSGIEQQTIGFLNFTVLDDVNEWEGSIYRDLLASPGDSEIEVRHRVEGLLRGDLASQREWFKAMREVGVYSANDVREKLDENPLAADKGGDEYTRPANWQPLGSAAPAPAADGGQGFDTMEGLQ